MERQPSLFDINSVPVKQNRPDQRPAKRPYLLDPTKDDFLTKDLTLPTRDWYGRWIKRYEDSFEFNRNEILLPNQLRLVNLYLFPQPPDGRWLTQEKVLGDTNTSHFR